MLMRAMWFLTSELKTAYKQVDMQPNNKDNTAFCTRQEVSQFTIMPFGLCSTADVQTADEIHPAKPHKVCLVYLDIIID